MSNNILNELRETMTKEGLKKETINYLMGEIGFHLQERFTFNQVKENLTKGLYPLRSEKLSILTGQGPTNSLINSNNLDALDMLTRVGKKADVVFMDLSYEHLTFNDETVSLSDQDLDLKWFTYIETRAKYIKKMLSLQGLVYIHTDDRYLAETKLILDKVFNPKNFVSNMVWKKPDSSIHNAFLNRTKEYVLVYKTTDLKGFRKKLNSDGGTEEQFNKLDRTRKYRSDYDYAISIPQSVAGESDAYAYAGGSKDSWDARQKGVFNEYDWKWMLTKEAFQGRLKDGLIKFEQSKTGEWKVYNQFTSGGDVPFDDFVDSPTYRTGTSEVEEMFNRMSKRKIKPTHFYKYLINLHPKDTIHVLDINGENGTLGQSILEMNTQDNGKRSFTIIADDNHDGYKEYFAYARLKKQIEGFNSLKSSKFVDGHASNLNVYDLVKKESIDVNNLFYSLVELLNNTSNKKVINDSLQKYLDSDGNSVFILEDTIVDNKELKEILSAEINHSKNNKVYIPSAIRTSELARELISIGLGSPSVKDMLVRK